MKFFEGECSRMTSMEGDVAFPSGDFSPVFRKTDTLNATASAEDKSAGKTWFCDVCAYTHTSGVCYGHCAMLCDREDRFCELGKPVFTGVFVDEEPTVRVSCITGKVYAAEKERAVTGSLLDFVVQKNNKKNKKNKKVSPAKKALLAVRKEKLAQTVRPTTIWGDEVVLPAKEASSSIEEVELPRLTTEEVRASPIVRDFVAPIATPKPKGPKKTFKPVQSRAYSAKVFEAKKLVGPSPIAPAIIVQNFEFVCYKPLSATVLLEEAKTTFSNGGITFPYTSFSLGEVIYDEGTPYNYKRVGQAKVLAKAVLFPGQWDKKEKSRDVITRLYEKFGKGKVGAVVVRQQKIEDAQRDLLYYDGLDVLSEDEIEEKETLLAQITKWQSEKEDAHTRIVEEQEKLASLHEHNIAAHLARAAKMTKRASKPEIKAARQIAQTTRAKNNMMLQVMLGRKAPIWMHVRSDKICSWLDTDSPAQIEQKIQKVASILAEEGYVEHNSFSCLSEEKLAAPGSGFVFQSSTGLFGSCTLNHERRSARIERVAAKRLSAAHRTLLQDKILAEKMRLFLVKEERKAAKKGLHAQKKLRPTTRGQLRGGIANSLFSILFTIVGFRLIYKLFCDKKRSLYTKSTTNFAKFLNVRPVHECFIRSNKWKSQKGPLHLHDRLAGEDAVVCIQQRCTSSVRSCLNDRDVLKKKLDTSDDLSSFIYLHSKNQYITTRDVICNMLDDTEFNCSINPRDLCERKQAQLKNAFSDEEDRRQFYQELTLHSSSCRDRNVRVAGGLASQGKNSFKKCDIKCFCAVNNTSEVSDKCAKAAEYRMLMSSYLNHLSEDEVMCSFNDNCDKKCDILSITNTLREVPLRETDGGLTWQSRDGAPASLRSLGNTDGQMEILPPVLGSLRDDNDSNIAPGLDLNKYRKDSGENHKKKNKNNSLLFNDKTGTKPKWMVRKNVDYDTIKKTEGVCSYLGKQAYDFVDKYNLKDKDSCGNFYNEPELFQLVCTKCFEDNLTKKCNCMNQEMIPRFKDSDRDMYCITCKTGALDCYVDKNIVHKYVPFGIIKNSTFAVPRKTLISYRPYCLSDYGKQLVVEIERGLAKKSSEHFMKKSTWVNVTKSWESQLRRLIRMAQQKKISVVLYDICKFYKIENKKIKNKETREMIKKSLVSVDMFQGESQQVYAGYDREISGCEFPKFISKWEEMSKVLVRAERKLDNQNNNEIASGEFGRIKNDMRKDSKIENSAHLKKCFRCSKDSNKPVECKGRCKVNKKAEWSALEEKLDKYSTKFLGRTLTYCLAPNKDAKLEIYNSAMIKKYGMSELKYVNGMMFPKKQDPIMYVGNYDSNKAQDVLSKSDFRVEFINRGTMIYENKKVPWVLMDDGEFIMPTHFITRDPNSEGKTFALVQRNEVFEPVKVFGPFTVQSNHLLCDLFYSSIDVVKQRFGVNEYNKLATFTRQIIGTENHLLASGLSYRGYRLVKTSVEPEPGLSGHMDSGFMCTKFLKLKRQEGWYMITPCKAHLFKNVKLMNVERDMIEEIMYTAPTKVDSKGKEGKADKFLHKCECGTSYMHHHFDGLNYDDCATKCINFTCPKYDPSAESLCSFGEKSPTEYTMDEFVTYMRGYCKRLLANKKYNRVEIIKITRRIYNFTDYNQRFDNDIGLKLWYLKCPLDDLHINSYINTMGYNIFSVDDIQPLKKDTSQKIKGLTVGEIEDENLDEVELRERVMYKSSIESNSSAGADAKIDPAVSLRILQDRIESLEKYSRKTSGRGNARRVRRGYFNNNIDSRIQLPTFDPRNMSVPNTNVMAMQVPNMTFVPSVQSQQLQQPQSQQVPQMVMQQPQYQVVAQNIPMGLPQNNSDMDYTSTGAIPKRGARSYRSRGRSSRGSTSSGYNKLRVANIDVKQPKTVLRAVIKEEKQTGEGVDANKVESYYDMTLVMSETTKKNFEQYDGKVKNPNLPGPKINKKVVTKLSDKMSTLLLIVMLMLPLVAAQRTECEKMMSQFASFLNSQYNLDAGSRIALAELKSSRLYPLADDAIGRLTSRQLIPAQKEMSLVVHIQNCRTSVDIEVSSIRPMTGLTINGNVIQIDNSHYAIKKDDEFNSYIRAGLAQKGFLFECNDVKELFIHVNLRADRADIEIPCDRWVLKCRDYCINKVKIDDISKIKFDISEASLDNCELRLNKLTINICDGCAPINFYAKFLIDNQPLLFLQNLIPSVAICMLNNDTLTNLYRHRFGKFRLVNCLLSGNQCRAINKLQLIKSYDYVNYKDFSCDEIFSVLSEEQLSLNNYVEVLQECRYKQAVFNHITAITTEHDNQKTVVFMSALVNTNNYVMCVPTNDISRKMCCSRNVAMRNREVEYRNCTIFEVEETVSVKCQGEGLISINYPTDLVKEGNCVRGLTVVDEVGNVIIIISKDIRSIKNPVVKVFDYANPLVCESRRWCHNEGCGDFIMLTPKFVVCEKTIEGQIQLVKQQIDYTTKDAIFNMDKFISDPVKFIFGLDENSPFAAYVKKAILAFTTVSWIDMLMLCIIILVWVSPFRSFSFMFLFLWFGVKVGLANHQHCDMISSVSQLSVDGQELTMNREEFYVGKCLKFEIIDSVDKHSVVTIKVAHMNIPIELQSEFYIPVNYVVDRQHSWGCPSTGHENCKLDKMFNKHGVGFVVKTSQYVNGLIDGCGLIGEAKVCDGFMLQRIELLDSVSCYAVSGHDDVELNLEYEISNTVNTTHGHVKIVRNQWFNVGEYAFKINDITPENKNIQHVCYDYVNKKMYYTYTGLSTSNIIYSYVVNKLPARGEAFLPRSFVTIDRLTINEVKWSYDKNNLNKFIEYNSLNDNNKKFMELFSYKVSGSLVEEMVYHPHRMQSNFYVKSRKHLIPNISNKCFVSECVVKTTTDKGVEGGQFIYTSLVLCKYNKNSNRGSSVAILSKNCMILHGDMCQPNDESNLKCFITYGCAVGVEMATFSVCGIDIKSNNTGKFNPRQIKEALLQVRAKYAYNIWETISNLEFNPLNWFSGSYLYKCVGWTVTIMLSVFIFMLTRNILLTLCFIILTSYAIGVMAYEEEYEFAEFDGLDEEYKRSLQYRSIINVTIDFVKRLYVFMWSFVEIICGTFKYKLLNSMVIKFIGHIVLTCFCYSYQITLMFVTTMILGSLHNHLWLIMFFVVSVINTVNGTLVSVKNEITEIGVCQIKNDYKYIIEQFDCDGKSPADNLKIKLLNYTSCGNCFNNCNVFLRSAKCESDKKKVTIDDLISNIISENIDLYNYEYIQCPSTSMNVLIRKTTKEGITKGFVNTNKVSSGECPSFINFLISHLYTKLFLMTLYYLYTKKIGFELVILILLGSFGYSSATSCAWAYPYPCATECFNVIYNTGLNKSFHGAWDITRWPNETCNINDMFAFGEKVKNTVYWNNTVSCKSKDKPREPLRLLWHEYSKHGCNFGISFEHWDSEMKNCVINYKLEEQTPYRCQGGCNNKSVRVILQSSSNKTKIDPSCENPKITNIYTKKCCRFVEDVIGKTLVASAVACLSCNWLLTCVCTLMLMVNGVRADNVEADEDCVFYKIMITSLGIIYYITSNAIKKYTYSKLYDDKLFEDCVEVSKVKQQIFMGNRFQTIMIKCVVDDEQIMRQLLGLGLKIMRLNRKYIKYVKKGYSMSKHSRRLFGKCVLIWNSAESVDAGLTKETALKLVDPEVESMQHVKYSYSSDMYYNMRTEILKKRVERHGMKDMVINRVIDFKYTFFDNMLALFGRRPAKSCSPTMLPNIVRIFRLGSYKYGFIDNRGDGESTLITCAHEGGDKPVLCHPMTFQPQLAISDETFYLQPSLCNWEKDIAFYGKPVKFNQPEVGKNYFLIIPHKFNRGGGEGAVAVLRLAKVNHNTTFQKVNYAWRFYDPEIGMFYNPSMKSCLGMSGLPIIDENGEVFDVCTSYYRNNNIGFYLPRDVLRPTVMPTNEIEGYADQLSKAGSFSFNRIVAQTGHGKSTYLPWLLYNKPRRTGTVKASVLVLNPLVNSVEQTPEFMKKKYNCNEIYKEDGLGHTTKSYTRGILYMTYGTFVKKQNKTNFLMQFDYVLFDEYHTFTTQVIKALMDVDTVSKELAAMGHMEKGVMKKHFPVFATMTATPPLSTISHLNPNSKIVSTKLTDSLTDSTTFCTELKKQQKLPVNTDQLTIYGMMLNKNNFEINVKYCIFVAKQRECEMLSQWLKIKLPNHMHIAYHGGCGIDPIKFQHTVATNESVIVVATDYIASGVSIDFDVIYDSRMRQSPIIEWNSDAKCFERTLSVCAITAAEAVQRAGRVGRYKQGTYYYASDASESTTMLTMESVFSAMVEYRVENPDKKGIYGYLMPMILDHCDKDLVVLFSLLLDNGVLSNDQLKLIGQLLLDREYEDKNIHTPMWVKFINVYTGTADDQYSTCYSPVPRNYLSRLSLMQTSVAVDLQWRPDANLRDTKTSIATRQQIKKKVIEKYGPKIYDNFNRSSLAYYNRIMDVLNSKYDKMDAYEQDVVSKYIRSYSLIEQPKISDFVNETPGETRHSSSAVIMSIFGSAVTAGVLYKQVENRAFGTIVQGYVTKINQTIDFLSLWDWVADSPLLGCNDGEVAIDSSHLNIDMVVEPNFNDIEQKKPTVRYVQPPPDELEAISREMEILNEVKKTANEELNKTKRLQVLGEMITKKKAELASYGDVEHYNESNRANITDGDELVQWENDKSVVEGIQWEINNLQGQYDELGATIDHSQVAAIADKNTYSSDEGSTVHCAWDNEVKQFINKVERHSEKLWGQVCNTTAQGEKYLKDFWTNNQDTWYDFISSNKNVEGLVSSLGIASASIFYDSMRDTMGWMPSILIMMVLSAWTSMCFGVVKTALISLGCCIIYVFSTNRGNRAHGGEVFFSTQLPNLAVYLYELYVAGNVNLINVLMSSTPYQNVLGLFAGSSLTQVAIGGSSPFGGLMRTMTALPFENTKVSSVIAVALSVHRLIMAAYNGSLDPSLGKNAAQLALSLGCLNLVNFIQGVVVGTMVGLINIILVSKGYMFNLIVKMFARNVAAQDLLAALETPEKIEQICRAILYGLLFLLDPFQIIVVCLSYLGVCIRQEPDWSVWKLIEENAGVSLLMWIIMEARRYFKWFEGSTTDITKDVNIRLSSSLKDFGSFVYSFLEAPFEYIKDLFCSIPKTVIQDGIIWLKNKCYRMWRKLNVATDYFIETTTDSIASTMKNKMGLYLRTHSVYYREPHNITGSIAVNVQTNNDSCDNMTHIEWYFKCICQKTFSGKGMFVEDDVTGLTNVHVMNVKYGCITLKFNSNKVQCTKFFEFLPDETRMKITMKDDRVYTCLKSKSSENEIARVFHNEKFEAFEQYDFSFKVLMNQEVFLGVDLMLPAQVELSEMYKTENTVDILRYVGDKYFSDKSEVMYVRLIFSCTSCTDECQYHVVDTVYIDSTLMNAVIKNIGCGRHNTNWDTIYHMGRTPWEAISLVFFNEENNGITRIINCKWSVEFVEHVTQIFNMKDNIHNGDVIAIITKVRQNNELFIKNNDYCDGMISMNASEEKWFNKLMLITTQLRHLSDTVTLRDVGQNWVGEQYFDKHVKKIVSILVNQIFEKDKWGFPIVVCQAEKGTLWLTNDKSMRTHQTDMVSNISDLKISGFNFENWVGLNTKNHFEFACIMCSVYSETVYASTLKSYFDKLYPGCWEKIQEAQFQRAVDVSNIDNDFINFMENLPGLILRIAKEKNEQQMLNMDYVTKKSQLFKIPFTNICMYSLKENLAERMDSFGTTISTHLENTIKGAINLKKRMLTPAEVIAIQEDTNCDYEVASLRDMQHLLEQSDVDSMISCSIHSINSGIDHDSLIIDKRTDDECQSISSSTCTSSSVEVYKRPILTAAQHVADDLGVEEPDDFITGNWYTHPILEYFGLDKDKRVESVSQIKHLIKSSILSDFEYFDMIDLSDDLAPNKEARLVTEIELSEWYMGLVKVPLDEKVRFEKLRYSGEMTQAQVVYWYCYKKYLVEKGLPYEWLGQIKDENLHKLNMCCEQNIMKVKVVTSGLDLNCSLYASLHGIIGQPATEKQVLIAKEKMKLYKKIVEFDEDEISFISSQGETMGSMKHLMIMSDMYNVFFCIHYVKDNGEIEHHRICYDKNKIPEKVIHIELKNGHYSYLKKIVNNEDNYNYIELRGVDMMKGHNWMENPRQAMWYAYNRVSANIKGLLMRKGSYDLSFLQVFGNRSTIKEVEPIKPKVIEAALDDPNLRHTALGNNILYEAFSSLVNNGKQQIRVNEVKPSNLVNVHIDQIRSINILGVADVNFYKMNVSKMNTPETTFNQSIFNDNLHSIDSIRHSVNSFSEQYWYTVARCGKMLRPEQYGWVSRGAYKFEEMDFQFNILSWGTDTLFLAEGRGGFLQMYMTKIARYRKAYQHKIYVSTSMTKERERPWINEFDVPKNVNLTRIVTIGQNHQILHDNDFRYFRVRSMIANEISGKVNLIVVDGGESGRNQRVAAQWQDDYIFALIDMCNLSLAKGGSLIVKFLDFFFNYDKIACLTSVFSNFVVWRSPSSVNCSQELYFILKGFTGGKSKLMEIQSWDENNQGFKIVSDLIDANPSEKERMSLIRRLIGKKYTFSYWFKFDKRVYSVDIPGSKYIANLNRLMTISTDFVSLMNYEFNCMMTREESIKSFHSEQTLIENKIKRLTIGKTLRLTPMWLRTTDNKGRPIPLLKTEFTHNVKNREFGTFWMEIDGTVYHDVAQEQWLNFQAMYRREISSVEPYEGCENLKFMGQMKMNNHFGRNTFKKLSVCAPVVEAFIGTTVENLPVGYANKDEASWIESLQKKMSVVHKEQAPHDIASLLSCMKAINYYNHEPFDMMPWDEVYKVINRKGAAGWLGDRNLLELIENPEDRKKVDKICDKLMKGEIPLTYVSANHKVEVRAIESDVRDDGTWEPYPKPRIIQFYDGHTRLAHMRLFGYMQTKHTVDSKLFWGSNTGRSLTDVGDHLYSEWKKYKKPLGMMMDVKAWDSNVTKEQQAVECEAFKPHYKKKLHKALETYFKIGMAPLILDLGGKLFFRSGQRASGDWNTSRGNGELNIAVIVQMICEALGKTPEWVMKNVTIIAEGDDAVIILEEDQGHIVLKYAVAFLKRVNKPPKLVDEEGNIRYTTKFTQLEFCSHTYKPVPVGDRVRFLPHRSLAELLGKFALTKKTAGIREGTAESRELNRSKAISYLLLYPGQPIIRRLALTVLTKVGWGTYDTKEFKYMFGSIVGSNSLMAAVRSVYGSHINSLDQIGYYPYSVVINDYKNLKNYTHDYKTNLSQHDNFKAFIKWYVGDILDVNYENGKIKNFAIKRNLGGDQLVDLSFLTLDRYMMKILVNEWRFNKFIIGLNKMLKIIDDDVLIGKDTSKTQHLIEIFTRYFVPPEENKLMVDEGDQVIRELNIERHGWSGLKGISLSEFDTATLTFASAKRVEEEKGLITLIKMKRDKLLLRSVNRFLTYFGSRLSENIIVAPS